MLNANNKASVSWTYPTTWAKFSLILIIYFSRCLLIYFPSALPVFTEHILCTKLANWILIFLSFRISIWSRTYSIGSVWNILYSFSLIMNIGRLIWNKISSMYGASMFLAFLFISVWEMNLMDRHNALVPTNWVFLNIRMPVWLCKSFGI